MINRRHFVTATAGVSLASALPSAFSQSKTTTVTVGFAPGGPGEVLARRLVEAMRQPLNQNIIVSNRPGAAGMLAVIALKGAPADGTQLVFSPPGIITTYPLVYKKLQYEPGDIEPVAGVCEFAFAFAVKASHPAKTLREYVELSKKDPKNALYGTVALGSMPHFVGYRLGREGGVSLQPVAYKGAKEIVNDLIGGSLPSGINVVSGFTAEHKAGTLRVLATTGSKRSKSLPDVPTFAEAGFPNIVAVESFAFYAPKGLPKPETDRIFRAVQQAVEVPEIKQFMTLNEFEPAPRTAEDYKKQLQASIDRWAPLIRASGFHVE